MKNTIKRVEDESESSSRNFGEFLSIVNALMFNSAEEVDKYEKEREGSSQIAFNRQSEEFKTGVKLYFKEKMIMSLATFIDITLHPGSRIWEE